MCIFKPPKPQVQNMPKQEEVVSKEDPVLTMLEQQKKRKGYQSTMQTGGMGDMSAAPIKKTQLGV